MSSLRVKRYHRQQISVGGQQPQLTTILAQGVLCRRLRADEEVHHIDGDPSNNSISNLKVMNSKDHRRLHRAIRLSGVKIPGRLHGRQKSKRLRVGRLWGKKRLAVLELRRIIRRTTELTVGERKRALEALPR